MSENAPLFLCAVCARPGALFDIGGVPYCRRDARLIYRWRAVRRCPKYNGLQPVVPIRSASWFDRSGTKGDASMQHKHALGKRNCKPATPAQRRGIDRLRELRARTKARAA